MEDLRVLAPPLEDAPLAKTLTSSTASQVSTLLLGQISDIPDLPDEIDLGSLRVYAPSQVIFLCGGPTRIINRPVNPESLRDAFERVRYTGSLVKYQVQLAEEVVPFYPRGNYRDLLSFESHIAQICEMILLFSESEGSLCELGAFAMEPEIARKMMIVILRTHYDFDSFIRLGPVQAQINNYGQQSVFVLDDAGLGISPGHTEDIDLDTFARDISEAIRDRLRATVGVVAASEHTTFDADRPGHIIKLSVGIIQHYGSMTSDEVLLILTFMGITIDAATLGNFLMCAKFVRWVDEDTVGGRVLFSARKGRKALSYALRTGSRVLDRDRWLTDVRTHWQATDRVRFTQLTRSASR